MCFIVFGKGLEEIDSVEFEDIDRVDTVDTVSGVDRDETEEQPEAARTFLERRDGVVVVTLFVASEQIADRQAVTDDSTIGPVSFVDPQSVGPGTALDGNRLREAIICFEERYEDSPLLDLAVVEGETGFEMLLLQPTDSDSLATPGILLAARNSEESDDQAGAASTDTDSPVREPTPGITPQRAYARAG